MTQRKTMHDIVRHTAADVHSRPQKSTTLQRRFVKQPNSVMQALTKTNTTTPKAMDIAKPKKVAAGIHTGPVKPVAAPIVKKIPSTAKTTATTTHTSPIITRTHNARNTRNLQSINSITPRRSRIITPSVARRQQPARTTMLTRKASAVVARQAAPTLQPKPTQAPVTPTHIEHPVMQKVRERRKTPTIAYVPKPAQYIKHEAISQALAQAPQHTPTQLKPSWLHVWRKRLVGIAAASTLTLAVAGYTLYSNAPAFVMSSANAQAGIEARYPGYTPAGYKLQDKVDAKNGEVKLYFQSTTDAATFTLQQIRSNWDSRTLLDNYVKEKSHGEYQTSTENGIAIYTYRGNGAWVTGGLLYIIEGNAPLSPDQIRRIAMGVV